jgi:hypothetical protein
MSYTDIIPSVIVQYTELFLILINGGLLGKKIKVEESRNRPGVAQRVPGDLGSQISMTFGS